MLYFFSEKRALLLSAFALGLLLAQCSADDVPCDNTARIAQLELCQDLRDIRDLIPANTLIYFFSSHYRSDGNFNKAMQYMKTPQFAEVSQQIAETDVYQQALQQFANAGVNTDIIANISNIFNCLLLSMPEYNSEQEEITNLDMQQPIVPRALNSLADELIKSIPKDAFNALILQKLNEGKDFANFYRIVHSNTFRSQMLKNLKSYQLSYPLSLLKRNKIDLCYLAKVGQRLFAQGPRG